MPDWLQDSVHHNTPMRENGLPTQTNYAVMLVCRICCGFFPSESKQGVRVVLRPDRDKWECLSGTCLSIYRRCDKPLWKGTAEPKGLLRCVDLWVRKWVKRLIFLLRCRTCFPSPSTRLYARNTKQLLINLHTWVLSCLDLIIIVLNFPRKVVRTERGNKRGNARNKVRFSRTSWLRNLHIWVGVHVTVSSPK